MTERGRLAFRAKLHGAWLASGAKKAHFAEMLGLSRQTFGAYLGTKGTGRFPSLSAALAIGGKLGWREREIRDWFGLTGPVSDGCNTGDAAEDDAAGGDAPQMTPFHRMILAAVPALTESDADEVLQDIQRRLRRGRASELTPKAAGDH